MDVNRGPSGPKEAKILTSDPPANEPRINARCRSAGMLLDANILFDYIRHAMKVMFLSFRIVFIELRHVANCEVVLHDCTSHRRLDVAGDLQRSATKWNKTRKPIQYRGSDF